MKVNILGGGPGGLYAGILIRKHHPDAQVTVFERNKPDDTFGFGVVFSDATLQEIAGADQETYDAITARFYHWDRIHIHYRGEVLDSEGHGFAGLSRRELLLLLHQRCEAVGVDLCFEAEVEDFDAIRDADLVIGADGVNSALREHLADAFEPQIDLRPNRFVWLGTTRPFPAFTFYFKEDVHGLWRVHAYQYDAEGNSTFIVEAREATWAAAGMDQASEEETVQFLSALFADELAGAPLVRNRSVWRQFPTVRNRRWSTGNVVLIGDAAHTAHFSVGSGTRLAMLDGIALVEALAAESQVGRALARYEEERRPPVESLQRAAQASLQWFEDVERYWHLEPTQFAFSLLTRSLRISHANLQERDPAFVAKVDRWVADQAEAQSGTSVAELESSLGVTGADRGAPPPMFTPFRLRDLLLVNRVGVSAMCQYSCDDGMPNDWHLVHLGSRGIGGAGLLMAEMTAVSRDGRISPGCAGLYLDAHIPSWRKVVDFVHQTSWTKIGIQLGHAGRKGATMLDWEGPNEPLPDGGWPIKSASPIPYFDHSPVPEELTRDEMLTVVESFRDATARALEAGFDMVEVHMAHGYLLASFLSPLTNRREDEYGGSLEGRVRFPAEVLRAVREVWPEERPVSVRISAVDWVPGGNGPEEAVAISKALREAGCDIVDVSAGQTVPYQRPVYGRQFQTPFADRIRNETGLATMAVGNISSPEDVNSIIAAGRADLCLLARAHLWDPYWSLHAAKALGYPLPWPKPYSTLNDYTPRIVS